MISAIVAVDQNMGIGYNNNLLARIPNDLKRFKEITTGKTVIMGRKTYDSLPRKPLPNRVNVILTGKPTESEDENVIYMNMDEVLEFINMSKDDEEEEVVVIGGATVYRQLLPYVDKIYLTQLCHEFTHVDSYFPHLDVNEWKVEDVSEILTFGNLVYQFKLYSRIN